MAACEDARYTEEPFQDSLDNFPQLQELLPKMHWADCYRVCHFESDGGQFRCTLRLALAGKSEALSWLQGFQDSSLTIWRVSKTYPHTGTKNIFRVDLHCHHNTHPKTATADQRKSSKNTHCPSKMYIIVKRSADCRGRNRSKDKHTRDGYPTVVTLKWDHNHPMTSQEVGRRRDVHSETRDKLLALYRAGHSPVTALDLLKYDLRLNCTDQEYQQASIDRAIVPDSQYCYRLFYREFSKPCAVMGGKVMLAALEQKLTDFNGRAGELCCRTETTAEGHTVVAVCTPLMKRAHSLWEECSRTVYVDSPGKTDRQSRRALLLLAQGPAGPLPLGAVLTTSESQPALVAGLRLLHSVLPTSAWFGSAAGPAVFVTEDCADLRSALRTVFPESTPLLGVGHLLQAAWRWLWEARHKVTDTDRPHLLGLLKAMLYADSEEELQASLRRATEEDPTCRKYPRFVERVLESFTRHVKAGFTAGPRADLPEGDAFGNSRCKAPVHLVRERVLHRLKAFNICQLADFLLTRLEDLNARRLLDLSRDRLGPSALDSPCFPCSGDVPPESVSRICDSEYQVGDEKADVVHHVDMEIDICSCPVGRTGAPCVHRAAVMRKYAVGFTQIRPVESPEMRQMLRTLATGSEADDVQLPPLQSGFSRPGALTAAEPAATSRREGTARKHGRRRVATDQPAGDQLRCVFESLTSQLQSDRGKLSEAVLRFVAGFNRLATRSQLIKALRMFGRPSGQRKRKRLATKATVQASTDKKAILARTDKKAIRPTRLRPLLPKPAPTQVPIVNNPVIKVVVPLS